DGWTLQPGDGGHPRGHHVQERRGPAGDRDRRERRAAGGEPHIGCDRDAATIDRAGHCAADERGGEKRDELAESEEADGERRSGQAIHLVRQPDVGDHRAEERHELCRVQEAIIPTSKRAEVHRCGERFYCGRLPGRTSTLPGTPLSMVRKASPIDSSGNRAAIPVESGCVSARCSVDAMIVASSLTATTPARGPYFVTKIEPASMSCTMSRRGKPPDSWP